MLEYAGRPILSTDPRRVPPAATEFIRHTRQEPGWGAARTRRWRRRMHGIPLAMDTIQHVFRDLRVRRLGGPASGRCARGEGGEEEHRRARSDAEQGE